MTNVSHPLISIELFQNSHGHGICGTHPYTYRVPLTFKQNVVLCVSCPLTHTLTFYAITCTQKAKYDKIQHSFHSTKEPLLNKEEAKCDAWLDLCPLNIPTVCSTGCKLNSPVGGPMHELNQHNLKEQISFFM